MACYSPGMESYFSDRNKSGGYPIHPAENTAKITQLEKELKQAKRLEPLLCSAARVLERLNYDFDENPELSEWWDSHKEKDLARLKLEEKKLKQQAWEKEQVDLAMRKPIANLTKEEKELLKKNGIL